MFIRAPLISFGFRHFEYVRICSKMMLRCFHTSLTSCLDVFSQLQQLYPGLSFPNPMASSKMPLIPFHEPLSHTSLELRRKKGKSPNVTHICHVKHRLTVSGLYSYTVIHDYIVYLISKKCNMISMCIPHNIYIYMNIVCTCLYYRVSIYVYKIK